MVEVEIKALKNAFFQGPIYIQCDKDDLPDRVVRICAAPALDGNFPKPGEVAYLEGGGYASLSNAKLCEFFTMNQITIQN